MENTYSVYIVASKVRATSGRGSPRARRLVGTATRGVRFASRLRASTGGFAMFRAAMRPAGWGLGLAALLGLAASAHAEDAFYKGKRVTLLVNFAVGGPTDIEG